MDLSLRALRLAALAVCLVGGPRGFADSSATQAAPNLGRAPGSVVVFPSSVSKDAEIEFFPLNAPSGPPRELGDTTTKLGRARRIFADWSKRREKSEDAPSIFDRFRKEKDPPSDSLLVSRCRAILVGEPTLRGVWIYVSANNGVLRLSGTVPSESTKAEAEVAARRTPGALEILNNLQVSSPLAAPTTKTFPSAATLDAPVALNGSRLNAATPVENAPKPAVILGQPLQVAARQGLPDVRTYVIQRPPSSPPAIVAMPPLSNDTREQLVAKTAVTPAALRPWSRTGDRPIIPARPMGPSSPVVDPNLSPTVVRAAPRPVNVSPAFLRSDERLEASILALLQADPRAALLRHDVRGTEIRLSGSIRTPEDLYDLSAQLNSLPGVDFVSFENVQFTY